MFASKRDTSHPNTTTTALDLKLVFLLKYLVLVAQYGNCLTSGLAYACRHEALPHCAKLRLNLQVRVVGKKAACGTGIYGAVKQNK